MQSPFERVFVHLALVAGLALCAGSASAQQFPSCPLSTNGADVICGAVSDSANYNIVGAMDATALGTTSCNVGNVVLNWFSGTVNHPLMGGQVYKYKVVDGSSRFESLGQSWLKHAFSALQGSLCCSNCVPATSQTLGVGCSDPYGGSLNGSQGRLGPKWQANPYTGAYVAAHQVASGGNNGRIQMLLSELEANSPTPTGVRYFGEMTYVALDDARGNNSDNNISYRELTCAAGTATQGFNFTAIGTTTRMQAGLEAWKLADPTVTITQVVVPEEVLAPYDGDARLMLGSCVTDLGNGTWHYEYALFNQNSDRSVASFSIPLTAGTLLTNVGFRDVPYLGGDGNGGVNFDGTDWPAVISGSAITWATAPFNANANANALRWESTYNFRFDANAPPVSGTIDIGQFKVVNNVAVSGIQVPGDAPTFHTICTNGSLGSDHATACPCGNTGAPANGCAHSASANGANLNGLGTAFFDNVQLDVTSLPSNAFALFLQHDAAGDAVFHDGVLCASGALVRLRGRNASGGAALFPDNSFAIDATTTLSQRGGVTVGSGATRYYSAFYRNASTTFCPPATANVTNGWVIDW